MQEFIKVTKWEGETVIQSKLNNYNTVLVWEFVSEIAKVI